MSSPSDQPDPSQQPDPSPESAQLDARGEAGPSAPPDLPGPADEAGQPAPDVRAPEPATPPGPFPSQGSAPSGSVPSWPAVPPGGSSIGYPGPSVPGPPSPGAPSPGAPSQGYPSQGFPPQGFPPQGFPPQGFPPQGVPGPGSYAPSAAGPHPYIQNSPFAPQYGPRKSSITTGGVFIGIGISVLVIIIAFAIHDIPGGTGPIRLLITGILPIVGCLLTIGRATRSIGLGMVIIGGAFWVTLIGPCFALFMP